MTCSRVSPASVTGPTVDPTTCDLPLQERLSHREEACLDSDIESPQEFIEMEDSLEAAVTEEARLTYLEGQL